MKSRAKIHAAIRRRAKRIEQLKAEILQLNREDCLLSDKKQQYREEKETIKERVNGKMVKVERLIGRVYFRQWFRDEDTGKKIWLYRSQVVTIDGKWDY